MTRETVARRIAEVLFNEPATRRGAGPAPTQRAARILASVRVIVRDIKSRRPQRFESLS
jgi:hypothetical protein